MAIKLRSPAAERNREPIIAVLRECLPAQGEVLEVASGSGQHAIAFAAAFPELTWQPTDPDPDARASIAAWVAEAGVTNVREPLALDAAAARWPVTRADAMVCINMLHIAVPEAGLGLFAGAARVLAPSAPLIVNGPFFRHDVPPEPSNVAFDASLKARDARWGLRFVEDVRDTAQRHGFSLARMVAMPAHNLSLVFRKD